MRYDALILKGFKRFALNQVSHFEIRPTEQVQLILGTNGSGKSSLLGELTPLPANPADYLKDGRKQIHIVSRGHTYICTSDFAIKQIHSFMKDGEELNPGGTGTVQKELCRQEFGVTPEIHELETGLIRLTDLGPSQRRMWFTQLSDVSYDYAIGVFNKLREEYNAAKYSLKEDKKRLVVEQTKIITEEEQRQLMLDVQQLHGELSQLLEMRAPIERPLADIQREMQTADSGLLTLSKVLLNIRVESPAHLYRNDWGELERLEFTSTEQVDDHIDDLRQQIAAQEAVLAKLYQDHVKQSETVAILKKQGSEGVESLQKKITAAQGERNDILAKRRLGLEGFTPYASLQMLDNIEHDLSAVLSELPINDEGQYSSQALSDHRRALEKHTPLLKQAQNLLAQLQAKAQHAKEHKEKGTITCPNCRHSFVNGFSPEALEVLGKHIDQAVIEVERVELMISIEQTGANLQQSYGDLYRQFIQIVRMSPNLTPFWDKVTELGIAKTAPKKILSMLEQLRFDLQRTDEAQQVEERIGELRKLQEQAAQVGDQNLTDASEKLLNLTLEVEALTKSLTRCRKDLVDFQNYRRQLAEALRLQQEIMKTGARYDALTHEAVETLRRTTILQCIQQTQSALARKEETLNTLKQQQAIVENLAATIARRTKEEEALKHVVRELSPTDGLIAEGLLGFIKQFTHEMNSLIRKIWAYPLEVQPCGIANERGAELDYKFPLVVGSKDNIISDVSRGSSGMQEIIDLAWKVISLKYLGLEHGALLLDEFGKTLDLEHRTAAIMAIKTLMETKPFTQLFMISHYESHYGAFTNAQVCVLDARNIATPKVFNQHVVIQ